MVGAYSPEVDVEPYDSSDLGGDPADDEQPSMTSASPSEDDDPEDPENPSGRKKKKERKTKRPEERSDAFPWGAWPRDAAVDTHR